MSKLKKKKKKKERTKVTGDTAATNVTAGRSTQHLS
jgi:hypothetical protein